MGWLEDDFFIQMIYIFFRDYVDAGWNPFSNP